MNSSLQNQPYGLPVTLQIVKIVFFTFLAYLVIGLQLAVLPPFVHNELRFSALLAGVVISTQYIATLLSRGFAGRSTDTVGPKYAAVVGMIACACSGLLMLLAGLLRQQPWWSLAALVLGRLALGLGESCIGTGCIIWGVGKVGTSHMARVIAWNGAATYGALAVGAPLGVALVKYFGFLSIGITAIALMILALALAWRRSGVAPLAGERMPMRHVFLRVIPYGCGLALASIGFGVIATFITLYYASMHWNSAALALSVFGLCFVSVRLAFGGLISRFGGYRVALVSFAFEVCGLMILALASSSGMAMLGAALTGTGFSLVYPALGMEAVERVSVHNRGAALSAYSVFIDVALGVTGPLGGWIAVEGHYPPLFSIAAVLSMIAALLTAALYVRFGRRIH